MDWDLRSNNEGGKLAEQEHHFPLLPDFRHNVTGHLTFHHHTFQHGGERWSPPSSMGAVVHTIHHGGRGARLPAWGLWSTPSSMGDHGPFHPVWGIGAMVPAFQHRELWFLPSSIGGRGAHLPARGAVVHTIQHGGPCPPHLLAWRTMVPQITRQYKSFVPKLLFSAVLVTMGSVINSCTMGHSRCNGRAVQRTCEAFSTTSLFLFFSPSLLSFPSLSSTSMAVIVFVTFCFYDRLP